MAVAKQRLQQNFSRAAAEYDSRAQFQHTQIRRVLDAALMTFPETATVADIGCGTAFFAAEAGKARPNWNILGIDIAIGMCDVASTRCSAIAGDATRLPLADESVDAAVSSLCYQWVDDQPAAFAELERVMKPGARTIISSLGSQTLVEMRACAMNVDLPLNLLPMRSFDSTATALETAGLDIAFRERRVVVNHYASVSALIQSIRAIGAGNNFETAPRGLLSPKRWAAFVAAYEAGRGEYGIPATWDHHFFVLHKPK
ncbi:MAG: methyltransferase domain-containing protein [Rickettsiales bacterium]